MKEVSGKIQFWTTIYFTFKVQLSFIQAAVDLRTKSQVICCVGLRCDLLVQRNPFNVKNLTKQKLPVASENPCLRWQSTEKRIFTSRSIFSFVVLLLTSYIKKN